MIRKLLLLVSLTLGLCCFDTYAITDDSKPGGGGSAAGELPSRKRLRAPTEPTGPVHMPVLESYEDKVLSIIGGESYFNESDDYLGNLNKTILIESI